MLYRLDSSIQPFVRLIGRVRYAAAWEHFERTEREYILYLMIDGKMAIEEHGVKYKLARGDYILLEPGLRHKGYEANPCEYFYVHFRHTGMSRAEEDEKQLSDEVLVKRHTSLISYGLADTLPTDTISYISKTGTLSQSSNCSQLFEMGISEYAKKLEQYRPVMANIVGLILTELSRDYITRLYTAKTNDIYTRSMSKTVELIHFLNNYYSSKITGQIIEKELDMSFDHLNRIFKRIYGQTIFSYLTEIRIKHAKDMLEETDLPISEVAYLIGFEDSSYFTKYFKQHTGTTPTQFWKLVHKNNKTD